MKKPLLLVLVFAPLGVGLAWLTRLAPSNAPAGALSMPEVALGFLSVVCLSVAAVGVGWLVNVLSRDGER